MELFLAVRHKGKPSKCQYNVSRPNVDGHGWQFQSSLCTDRNTVCLFKCENVKEWDVESGIIWYSMTNFILKLLQCFMAPFEWGLSGKQKRKAIQVNMHDYTPAYYQLGVGLNGAPTFVLHKGFHTYVHCIFEKPLHANTFYMLFLTS